MKKTRQNSKSERASVVSRGLDQPPSVIAGRNFWSCGVRYVKTGFVADAAEIRVLASGALKLALTRLVPDFEKSSGDTVTVEYGPAGSVAKRVERGEPADVAIVTARQLEALESQGKITKGSRVNIAGIAIGVAVRKGAPRPDIGTVEAFKRALLLHRARSVTAIRQPARRPGSMRRV